MTATTPQCAFSELSKTAGRRTPPTKLKNKDVRTREHLTQDEVTALMQATKTARHGQRNATLILMMFRHGLRVGEAVQLKWEQVNFTQANIHLIRLKQGRSSTHPLGGNELRALRRLQRDYPATPYLFVSQQQAPLTERAVHKIIAQAGQKANLSLSVHPHMLRHATGFYLANKGVDTRTIQAYLGHADIRNTVIYTELAATRFQNLWIK